MKIKIIIFLTLLIFNINADKPDNFASSDQDFLKLIDNLFDIEENDEKIQNNKILNNISIKEKVEEKSTKTFSNFLEHFNKYYPRVFLIREKFLTNMTAENIAMLFEKIVNTIAYKPYFYVEELFTILYKKLNLNEKIEWQKNQYNIELLEEKFKNSNIKNIIINNNGFEEFIADQLSFFHEFLKYAKIDINTKIVFYEKNKTQITTKSRLIKDPKQQIENLINYWAKNNIKIHLDFYELCFDYWSRLFIKAICTQDLKKANRFINDLKKIATFTKNNALINEFLNKYNELQSLLKKEHYSKKFENLMHDKEFADILEYHGITA